MESPLNVDLEHPLPEDIRNMDRDDTVCKFCGVSYFIHHEIKQLQTEIAELKKELALRENVKSENDHLKTESKTLNQKLTECKSQLSMNKENFDILEAKLAEEQTKIEKGEKELNAKNKEIENLLSELQSLREKNSSIVKLIPTIAQQCQRLRSNHSDVRMQIAGLNSEMSPLFQSLKSHMQKTETASVQEIDRLKRDKTDYVGQLAKLTEQLEERNVQCTKLTSDNDELLGLEKAYAQLKAMYAESQLQKTEMDQIVAEKNEELRRKAFETAQYQQLSSSKDSEMETLKKQLENNSASLQKSLQWYKDEVAAKNSSIADLEVDIARLRDQMTKNEALSNRKFAETEQAITDYEKIKEAFIIAKSENESLRQEREVLIAAHQRRLEELQENFRQRLNSGGTDFEAKLKESLLNEREKFAREKQMILDSMAESHKIELDIERQKFNELQGNQSKIVEATRNEMISYAREEAKALQTTISSLKRDLQVTKSSCDEKLESKHRDLELVTQRLRAAEEKLNEQQSMEHKLSADEANKLEDVLRENEVLGGERNQLKSKLEEALSEVKSLQDTVRRECEERFELTEALSDARETLLKNHLINGDRTNSNAQMVNKHTMHNGSTRLPELNQFSFNNDASQNGYHMNGNDKIRTDLPPKAPMISSRSQQMQYTKEPTPPQPESRDGSSHRSFPRKGSTQSRASVSSHHSVASQPQDRTMALYRAAKLQSNRSTSSSNSQSECKPGSNNSNGAKNEFKTMLNLAMRRGSSQ